MASAAKEATSEWTKLLSSQVLKKLNIEPMTVSNDFSNGQGGGGGAFAQFAGLFSSQDSIKRNSRCNYFIFSKIKQDTIREIINSASLSDNKIDRAIGSVVGMGLGDAFGAPLEFRNCLNCVMNDKESLANSQDSEEPKPELKIITTKKNNKCELEYIWESNKFGLSRGQWTDDASMGLCMADSLIINKIYDGSDIRVRFYNWWHNGYNNAFRNDKKRAQLHGGQGSVGLGGNISQSIYSMKDYTYPTSIYQVDHDREDSGNGSIMRLSPVPVFFHNDINLAREYASQSSFTTHPGYIAGECCSFMSFIIIKAIYAPTTQNKNNNTQNDNKEKEKENKEEQTSLDSLVPKENVKLWLDLVTKEYFNILTKEIEQLEAKLGKTKDNKQNDNNTNNNNKEKEKDKDNDIDMTSSSSSATTNKTQTETDEKTSDKKDTNNKNKNNNDTKEQKLIRRLINAKKLIIQLIDCDNISSHPKEWNWNWKLSIEEYKQAMIDTYHKRRGNVLQDGKWKYGQKMYNGYPVSATYWGSYCMDGIAMGLHGVYNSKNFAHAIQLCVNLLGDADSTGSIGGQIAGSIYGYQSLLNDNKFGGNRMVELLNEWDDQGFALRGLLLYQLGKEYKETNENDKQAIQLKRKQIENEFNKLAGKKGGKKMGWASRPQA